MLDQRLYCGLTLMELSVAAGFAVLLVGLVLPPMKSHAERLRRADAIAALTRIELAQENFRASKGGYAQTLSQLDGASAHVSAQGHYALELKDASASGYTVVARAVTGAAKGRDDRCATLTLTIDGRRAMHGPLQRCWAR